MELFETWGRTEWVLLVVNVIAVYIVVRFLKSRVELKLREVEARQAHERLMRKRDRNAEETND
ncbi:MAG: hypothetical protein VX151_02445 [Candidatus Thermoplasmatota archaeon]|nr:hypothetical protein [Candidatus Thermoplasmatota archaeon]